MVASSVLVESELAEVAMLPGLARLLCERIVASLNELNILVDL
jgi:hypothetical protein